MAQAKPGRPKAPLALATVDYQPPSPPPGLADSQLREWDELIGNPLLSREDDSLLFDYIRTATLRDLAFEDLQQNGLTVPGAKGDAKTNVCWKIYRDCQDHLIKLRQLMMLTPRARAELRASGLLELPQAEDDLEID